MVDVVGTASTIKKFRRLTRIGIKQAIRASLLVCRRVITHRNSMKLSDSLMRQEWGPLASEALFGKSEDHQDHFVVLMLEEYHASYAHRELNNKLYRAHEKIVHQQIFKKYKKTLQQLPKDGKKIPDSFRLKLGNEFTSRMSKIKWPAELSPSSTSKHLMRLVEAAIIHNKPKILSNLANAIKRIHGDGNRIKSRISGVGPTFKIEPHDPILLHGLKLKADSKIGSTKSHFKESVKRETGLQVGDKKAQRTLRKLGVPPSKGGRPRKHHPKNGHG
jgi:hypothetical protein